MVFIPVSPWRVAHTQTGCSVYLSTMSVLAEGVIWSFVLSYPPRTGVFSGRKLAYVFQQYTEACPLAGSLTLVVFVLEISYDRLCCSRTAQVLAIHFQRPYHRNVNLFISKNT